MEKLIKVFDILFGSYVEELALHITAVIQAIILFFGGLIYGDAPIDLKFSYEIPTRVYEYEAGDKVHIHGKIENVGRPFEDHSLETITIFLYKIEDGHYVYPYKPYEGPYPDGEAVYFVKHGDILEDDFTFTVREDAPEGTYMMTLRSFGDEEVFENVITIK